MNNKRYLKFIENVTSRCSTTGVDEKRRFVTGTTSFPPKVLK